MSDSHARQFYTELSEKCRVCVIRGFCNRPAEMWRYGRRRQCFRTKTVELPAQQHSVTSQKTRIPRHNIRSHQLILGSGNAVTFFGNWPFKIMVETLPVLTEFSVVFIHVLWTNDFILTQFGHDYFLWNRFYFFHFQLPFRFTILWKMYLWN